MSDMLGKEVRLKVPVFSATDRMEAGTVGRVSVGWHYLDGKEAVDLVTPDARINGDRRREGRTGMTAPLTIAQFRALKKPKQSKYRNKPVVVDGVRFASKAEAARDAELLLLQRAGKVFNIKRQPRYALIVNGVKVCTYVGDWRYFVKAPGYPSGLEVVEDRKGAITPAFKIKWALAKALHPEIEWRLS